MVRSNLLVIGGVIISEVEDIFDGRDGLVKFQLRNESATGKSYDFTVNIQKQLMEEFTEGSIVEIKGELREYGAKDKGNRAPRKISFISAEEIYTPEVGLGYVNNLRITGSLIKDPITRTSYSNLDDHVCDFTLKVLTRNNMFSYIKCSAWEKHYDKASQLKEGNVVTVAGKVSSRVNKFKENTCTLMVHSID